jgi:hypothetical protein
MRNCILSLLLITGCATTHTPVVVFHPPNPEPFIVDTIHETIIVKDTTHTYTVITDTIAASNILSITDFGAVGNGSHDDADAIQAAIDYVIKNPQPLIVPIGNFIISHSILAQNNGKYFTLHLSGIFSNKSSSNEYLSKITYIGKSGFAIGVQFGRSIEIENITILGQYTFPQSVNNYNIGTVKFSDWMQPSITDTRYSPYCGISIDPYQNASGTRGGTSDVTIKNCSIKQFMVGIALSPNGYTQNDEMINILEDNIDGCRIAIAVCQDQSKTVNIKGLKVWASTYTILDGLTYGAGTGGGSVFCENWNIAGNVNQLFNLTTSRFPLSAKDIYSESLFRIGFVDHGAGSNFINFQIDFLSGPGMPAPDYLIGGVANFYGGMLRYYDGSYFPHRLNFAGLNCTFRDMTLNMLPIIRGLYGIPTNSWYSPTFDHVNAYYSYTPLVDNARDSLIYIRMDSVHIDRVNWNGVVYSKGIGTIIKPGDYILAEPTSTTRKYYDAPFECNTKQLGRVKTVGADEVTIDDVGLNAYSGNDYGAIYISRIK